MRQRIFKLLRKFLASTTSPVEPNYIILGAQKCGTSSLQKYLTEHPDILEPQTKELHFFDVQYDNGMHWYRQQFPNAEQLKNKIVGEATPSYLYHPLAPKRIFGNLTNTKFIIILRNPVERAFSQYCMKRRLNTESVSFEEAIECEMKLLETQPEINDNWETPQFHYLVRGLYVQQLKRWFALFDRENFHIIDSRHLLNDTQTTVSKVFNFLGVENHQLSTMKKHGKYPQKFTLSDETRQRLSAFFMPYNRELYNLLGIDFDWS